MSTSFDNESEKSPETLEQEINAKRESISHIVDSLESRLTPGQLFDQALAYTKGNGGEFFGNLGTTLKNNPVPTALTALGLAWLALNQNRPFNPGPVSYGPGLGDKLHDAVDTVKGALSSAGDRLHSATDSAKAKAYDLKDKATGLKDKASDMSHDTGDSLNASADSLRRSAHDVSHQVQQGVDVAKSQFDTLLREQPLVIAAIGIALGAAIGAALPSTRKEDELMGAASDQVTGTLKAKGEQVYAEAKDTVKQKIGSDQEPPKSGTGTSSGSGTGTSSGTGTGSSTGSHTGSGTGSGAGTGAGIGSGTGTGSGTGLSGGSTTTGTGSQGTDLESGLGFKS